MHEAIAPAAIYIEYRAAAVPGVEASRYWHRDHFDVFDNLAAAFRRKDAYEKQHGNLEFRVKQGQVVYTQPPVNGTFEIPVDSKIATAAKKVPLDMVPMSALAGVARVLAYGAKKHGHGNYANGTDDAAPQRYMGGVRRHDRALQAIGGKYTFESIAKLDDESGLPEIDHMICGLLMLRDIAVKTGALPEDPGIGNEPPTEK